MAAPLDFTGRRFGSLVAVQRIAGQPTRYLCTCDCGRECIVDGPRLSKNDDSRYAVRACDVCRSRPCAVCGAPYLKAGSAKTCGAEACRLAYRRARNAELAARVPEEVRLVKRKQYCNKLYADPVRRAAKREADAERRIARRETIIQNRAAKREADALRKASKREAAALRAATAQLRKAAQRQARSEASLSRYHSLTQEQREYRRLYQREYYRQNKEKVRMTLDEWLARPGNLEKSRKYSAASKQRRMRRKALQALMQGAAKLIEKKDKQDGSNT